MKRKVVIAFLALVSLAALGTLAVLRTPWAGARVCALAERKVRSATGLELLLESCRIDPLRLELSAQAVRLGPAAAPVFLSEEVRVRLTPLQALGGRIQIEDLDAVRPRLALSLPRAAPGAPPAACPPGLLSQFELHHLQVREGTLDLALPGGERVVAAGVEIRSSPAPLASRIRSLAAPRTSRIALEMGPVFLETPRRRWRVDSAHAVADLALDLSRLEVREAELRGEEMGLSAHGSVRDLCRPVLELDAAADGPVPALLALLGRPDVSADGTARVEARVAGPPAAPEIRGGVRLHRARIAQYVPGDARFSFRLAGSEVGFEDVEVPFQGGAVRARGTLRLGREPTLSADLETRHIEFAELLERLGLPGAHVTMRLTTRARVSGSAWPLDLGGEAGVDVEDFRVLDHEWKSHVPGEAAALEFSRGRLDAGVRITADAVEVRDGRARVGSGVLGVSGELSLHDGFRLDVDGTADLGALGHVAAVPWAGEAEVAAAIRAETYGDPHVEGRMRATGFHFLDLDLGQAAARVTYARKLLSVEGLEGRKGETRYVGDGSVDLGRTPAFVAAARLEAHGRLRDLFDAVLPWLPSARRVRDALDGQVSARAAARGPVTGLDADFEAALGRGALLGRAFEAGAARGRVVRGERAVFERAELSRNGGAVRATGEIGFGPGSPWSVEIAWSGLALAELGLPGDPWSGTSSGAATLGGSVEEPSVRFAASGEGVTVRGVPLGSVQAGGKLSGDDLAITGTLPGVQFSGTARLAGDRAFRARADVDLEDIARFIPGGPPAGLRAEVQGTAEASGRLDDLAAARASVRFERLRGGYGDFRVDNRGPVAIAVDRGRVEVESFVLRGVNTEFALAGRRASDGQLDLSASGSLDLRLLGGLVPAVARTHGQLTVDARVTGTVEEPLLVGAGRIREAGFRVRELPLEFGAMSGELAFSQNRVLFDNLSATLNGGRATLRGEVELAKFVPKRLRAEAELDTVPMTIPSAIPSWVSGRLTAFGSPDAMTLAGRLHVLRARYTEKVDLEKSLLEFRRRGTFERAYDRPADWLRFDIALVVDGDARIENDLVSGGVRGDLTVTGTVGSMGMLGSLSMTPGSRATFRGNEFALSHAVMDFTERHRVRATVDVHGDALVGEYQVFMHLFGPLEDPQLQLTSAPALSQQDIITLLSLGFTPRDTAASGGVSGAATAAAAQALFSVSGLDEQLKRFLPREGLFRDFSVRITSAYSEWSGQVEPRAELESRLWHDRLRLRFQSPLSGVGRGQRAQAELRLGKHSSLQGQWDSENPSVGSDLGLDLKLRWEWSD